MRPARGNWLFWLILGFVLGAWARATPLAMLSFRLVLFIAIAIWIVPFLIFNGRRLTKSMIEAALYAPTCPSCGHQALERRAVVSFGDRYYECGDCDARWKRKPLGPWEPALGKRDAQIYTPVRRSPFEGEPWDEEENLNGWKSIDSLVRNRRHRQDAH